MKNLLDSQKLMNRYFRKIDDAVWDMMTGRIGLQTAEGIVTIEGEGDDAQTVINMLDQFGMAVPAFAQNTPFAQVQIGDLIYGAKAPLGWVVEKKDKSVILMKADGTRSKWVPPKHQFLGFENGVMVLRSLMNMLPGGSDSLGQMQGMLMPMMMMGGLSGDDDSGIDLDMLMPMMLMSQMGSNTVIDDDGNSVPNPMAGMNLQNMLMPMMMMQMMGGKSGKRRNWFDNDK